MTTTLTEGDDRMNARRLAAAVAVAAALGMGGGMGTAAAAPWCNPDGTSPSGSAVCKYRPADPPSEYKPRDQTLEHVVLPLVGGGLAGFVWWASRRRRTAPPPPPPPGYDARPSRDYLD
ncbi:hypothetical protein [Mycobacterium servetii]|uniref:Secreted protein n=1 Tax=Mycobacterium servetii TaxID=3237418 RepID=A0ABV4BUG7_9MYCO